ncbi:MAG: hypothetical protein WAT81_05515 [Candidatus Moraniibacteriota bacterium]
MTHLNILVLGQLNGTWNGGYAVELQHRLPALLVLYQKQCHVPLDTYHFGSELQTFIRRGGYVHYALGQPITEGAESPLFGFATVANSNSLLEYLFPVERFIVDGSLDPDTQLAVATALIKSITDQAEAALNGRPDDIWIQVSFPAGADSLESNQAAYTALEQGGFKACRSPGQVYWTNWLKQPPARAAA